MWTSGSGLLVGILMVPAIVATLAFLIGQRAPRRFGEAGAITAAAGFLAAAALAVGAGSGNGVSAHLLGGEFAVDRLATVLLLLVFGVHHDCHAMRTAMRAWTDATMPDGATRTVVEHAIGSIVRRGAAADSLEAITSAHIVETGLSLLERSPVIARRVDAGQCAIVCATTNPADGNIVAHGTIGAVGEVDGALLECV